MFVMLVLKDGEVDKVVGGWSTVQQAWAFAAQHERDGLECRVTPLVPPALALLSEKQ